MRKSETQRSRQEASVRPANVSGARIKHALSVLGVTQDQLRQAVKMEAIGRLAGGIAHDFNNMLTAILGNVQLITMRMDEDDENQRMLGEIRIAARRSADLTRQLLAIADVLDIPITWLLGREPLETLQDSLWKK